MKSTYLAKYIKNKQTKNTQKTDTQTMEKNVLKI